MAEKLTDARVRSAPVKGARYSIMDGKEPGLELRILPDGRRVFALRRSVEGRDVRVTIGLYDPPRLTLEIARAKAGEIKVRLRNEGDYRESEREERERAKAQRKFTLSDLADAWLADQAKRLRASTLALYRQRIDTHIRPALGERSIDDVKRSDVRELVAAIGEKTPRTANAVRGIVALLYTFAQNELERECNNPAAGMRGFKQEPRSRALSDAEIKRLWEALSKADLPPGPQAALGLKLALYSCQRIGEIAGMRDSEIDLEERVWIVPAERCKSGRANAVPLTPRLVLLIAQAQALRSPPKDAKGNALPFPADAPVFPSPSDPAQPMTRHAFSRGMARLLEKVNSKVEEEAEKFAGCTPHDLRRSARTLLSRERLGVGSEIAERLLSHVVGSTISRTYDVHAYAAEKRRALERLSTELDRIISGRAVQAADNVVEMRA